MTLEQARNKAMVESRNGYVQHVNVVTILVDGEAVIDGNKRLDYVVSDWTDGAFTVVSFENGREL